MPDAGYHVMAPGYGRSLRMPDFLQPPDRDGFARMDDFPTDVRGAVTDIYVDDMVNPIARIDTYERCDRYVQIENLCQIPHTMKVEASTDGNMAGVIPNPHRPVPGLWDNDVWYFCFGNAGGPARTKPTTWGGTKSLYR